jgi:allantoicase
VTVAEALVDLAAEAFGGQVLFANDEFFAPAASLVAEPDPEWREGVYTDRGKWMDGWESRRRRQPGNDWCVVRLGLAGLVRRVVVDTTHFKGNAPEAFGLDGCGLPPWTPLEDLLSPDAPWTPVVDRAELRPDHRNEVDVRSARRVTHVRLRIEPDGGVARLRLLGVPLPAFPDVAPDDGLPDLAGLKVGGSVEAVSDSFFSSPDHLLRPGPPRGMHDGWETKRRRGDDTDHDWLVVRLGLPGTVERVLVDTTHFKGNAPGWISVDAAGSDAGWEEIVARRAVEPDRHHLVEVGVRRPATRLRLKIYPDGGVARFRAYGAPDADARKTIRLAYLNSLYETEARRFFRTVCGAERFAAAMDAGRPYFGTSAVLDAAAKALDDLEEADWLEAFAAHPRIGERTTAFWAAREQAATAGAGDEVRAGLAEGNAEYEAAFGFPFIVFASGKSAEEMLAILRQRLDSDRAREIETAAGEQRQISALRLRRMLCMGDG